MLTLTTVVFIGLGSLSSLSTDSVDFTPTERTIIVIGHSSQLVDSMDHSSDDDEAFSDFQYYLNRVVVYMREKDVMIQEAESRVIRIHSRKHEIDRIIQGQFTDSDGNNHLFGLIVVEPGRSPLVIYGVDTDDGYIQAIKKYFRVR